VDPGFGELLEIIVDINVYKADENVLVVYAVRPGTNEGWMRGGPCLPVKGLADSGESKPGELSISHDAEAPVCLK
jgi:hypothetical protein